MTTLTAGDFTVSKTVRRQQFFLRRLHSLTGILFGGYLILHLVVNATLIQGSRPHDFYQEHVDKIHSVPFLLIVEWTFIFLPILFHAIYGIWITLAAKWNVDRYPLTKNWLYVLQRISGIILAAFILFHVLSLKGLLGSRLGFDPAHATYTVVKHMNTSWAMVFLIYPIGILASAYHTANGFWTAAITWGITTSSGGRRRWGHACVGLGVVLLVAGFVALFATSRDASHIQDLQPITRT